MESLGGRGKCHNGPICGFDDACEVESDEIWATREDTSEGGIGDGATIDEGEPFQSDALGET